MELNEARGWRPEEGAVLVGEIMEVSRGWSDQGKGSYYPIVTVRPKDGSEPVAVHCFHFVLQKRMLELRPEVGETIGIKFVGQRKTKDEKRTISVYVVKMPDRRGGAATVWDSLGSPAPARTATDAPVEASDFAVQTQPGDDDIPF